LIVQPAKTPYIERGSPWENGYIESFNTHLRDELLNGEIFYTVREAQIVIESWRCHYNTIRPHDPPPLKWSDLRYVFDIQEDCNGKEAIQA